jgi:hypothetical protein
MLLCNKYCCLQPFVPFCNLCIPNICPIQPNIPCPDVITTLISSSPFILQPAGIGINPPSNPTGPNNNQGIYSIIFTNYSYEANSGGINYDPTTGQFTVPISGKYLIAASFSISSNLAVTTLNNYFRFNFYIFRNMNTLVAAESYDVSSPLDVYITISAVVNLNTGDKILFAAFQNYTILENGTKKPMPITLFPQTNTANRFTIVRLC